MLAVTSVELYKESRGIEADSDNISQQVSFALNGNFFDVAEEDDNTLWGLNDDHQVMAACFAIFPWFREFRLQTGEMIILIMSNFSAKQVNDSTWRVDITYELPQGPNSNINQDAVNGLIEQYNLGPASGENNGAGWSDEFTQLSFDTQAEQIEVNTSRTVAEITKANWLPAGVSIPSDQVGKPGPIGVTADGPGHAHIYTRTFSFNITQYFPPSKLKYAYVRKLYRLTGTLNKETFFGFPKGSVLFLGASGTGTLAKNVPVTFSFAVRPNFKFSATETILSNPNTDNVNQMVDVLGDSWFANTSQDKGLPGGAGVHSGWSTVDYRYRPVPDTDAKTLLMKPAFRYIHLCYEFGDFDGLGL